jgi:hypothetical protein
MKSKDPIFSFGRGRNQILIIGERAITDAMWAIRSLLLARAISILVPTLVAVGILLWRLS